MAIFHPLLLLTVALADESTLQAFDLLGNPAVPSDGVVDCPIIYSSFVGILEWSCPQCALANGGYVWGYDHRSCGWPQPLTWNGEGNAEVKKKGWAWPHGQQQ